jgi:hypothetical protein
MTHTDINTIIDILNKKGYKINEHVAKNLPKHAGLLAYTTDEEFARLCIMTDGKILAMPYKKDSVMFYDRNESDNYYRGSDMHDDFLRIVKDCVQDFRDRNAWDIPEDADYKACGCSSLSSLKNDWEEYDCLFQGGGGGLNVWDWMDMKRKDHIEWQEYKRRQIIAQEKQQQQERAQEMDKWESDRMEVRGRTPRKISWLGRLLKGR